MFGFVTYINNTSVFIILFLRTLTWDIECEKKGSFDQKKSILYLIIFFSFKIKPTMILIGLVTLFHVEQSNFRNT